MVDNIVLKSLGLVLIITAHMVFNGRADTGLMGNNITLQFKFNVTVTKDNHLACYKEPQTKVAEYSKQRSIPEDGDIIIYPKNTSVFCHITNLKLNHSGIYWASLLDSGLARESLRVQLIVQEKEHISNTVSPKPNDITTNKDRGSPSFFSSHIVTVLVVSPVVLMAAVLPWLIWCLLRTKDTQQRQPEPSPNPTVQETIEATNTIPAPPLVYSVLDFPKRPSAVLEINPSDTEYAAVSYLPENQQR
ncbi:uncharacterized protein LOC117253590 isoform X1 [Epinephelus lanceolatus]